jgi:hypothetical protein
MNVKRLAAAAAIAAGIGMSALASGVGLVAAAPLGPPPNCPECQQDPSGQWGIPALKCWPYGRVGGGDPVLGGGQPGYLPQCKVTAPAGPPPR